MGLFSRKTRKYVSVASVLYNLMGDEKPINYILYIVLAYIKKNDPENSLAKELSISFRNSPLLNLKNFINWAKTGTYNKTIGILESKWDYKANFELNKIQQYLLTNVHGIPENLIIHGPEDLEKKKGYYLNIKEYTVSAFDTYLYAKLNVAYKNTKIPKEKPTKITPNPFNTDDPDFPNEYPIQPFPDKNYQSGYSEIHNFFCRTKRGTNEFKIQGVYQHTYYIHGRKYFEERFTEYYDELSRKTALLDKENNKVLYIEYSLIYNDPDNIPLNKGIDLGIIYCKGEGIAEFDRVFQNKIDTEYNYAPYIPLRAFNHTITSKDDLEVYKECGKACKKVFTKNNYQEFLDSINENESIKDINFAYLTFGIPLNIKYSWGKEYIWQFFAAYLNKVYLGPYKVEPHPTNGFDSISIGGFGDRRNTLIERYSHPVLGWDWEKVLLSTAITQYLDSQRSEYIYSNYHLKISFDSVYSFRVHGKAFKGVKLREVYLGTWDCFGGFQQYVTTTHGVQNDHNNTQRTTHTVEGWSFENPVIYIPNDSTKKMKTVKLNLPEIFNQGHGFKAVSESFSSSYVDKVNVIETKYVDGYIDKNSSYIGNNTEYVKDVLLIKQYSENEFQVIVINGLEHENLIYSWSTGIGDESVIYYGDNEIKRYPKDTEYSGFILPIEIHTLEKMSFNNSVNCMQFAYNILFNCYKEKFVKQKWYQTGFFKFFTIVVVMIAIVYQQYYAAAALKAVGIGAMVASTIGVVGTTAIIVSTVVNLIVGLLIGIVLNKVSSKLFGPILGPVIATVISYVITIYAPNVLMGTQTTSLTNYLTSPSTLLALTNAAAKGYGAAIMQKIQALQGEALAFISYTTDKNRELEEAYNKNIYDLHGLDSTFLYNINNTTAFNTSSMYIAESYDEFFARTMVYGDEIASVHQDSVYKFTDIITTITV